MAWAAPNQGLRRRRRDATARHASTKPRATLHHKSMFAAPSALHVTNLTGLVWLRKECRECAGRASELFDFGADDALFYRDLSDGAMEGLCSEFDLSLFVPRFDSHTLPAALADARKGRRDHHPTELELHNLGHLQALREACQRSSGDAVWTYRINQETADAYRALDHDHVIALCKTLTVSAVVPRYDAAEAARILEKPAGARALFAAAYETDIAAASEAARRSVYLTH
jgi:hypothetical protein